MCFKESVRTFQASILSYSYSYFSTSFSVNPLQPASSSSLISFPPTHIICSFYGRILDGTRNCCPFNVHSFCSHSCTVKTSKTKRSASPSAQSCSLMHRACLAARHWLGWQDTNWITPKRIEMLLQNMAVSLIEMLCWGGRILQKKKQGSKITPLQSFKFFRPVDFVYEVLMGFFCDLILNDIRVTTE